MTADLLWIVVGLAWQHAGSLLLAMFLWGMLGTLLGLGFYVAVIRKGWLGPAADRRWARITLLVVMLLVVAPLFSAAGGVAKMGDICGETIAAEVKRAELDHLTGGIVLSPLVLADALVEGRTDLLDAYPKDLTWLLDPKQRARALQRGADAAVLKGLEASLGDATLTDSELGQWVQERATSYVVGVIGDKLTAYDELIGELSPEPDGSLGTESARRQAGARTIERLVITPVTTLFGGMRNKLLLLALLLALLTLFALRTIARRLPKPTPPG